MSVCAKFQLSSSFRSAWKVSVGCGVCTVIILSNPTVVLCWGWGFDNILGETVDYLHFLWHFLIRRLPVGKNQIFIFNFLSLNYINKKAPKKLVSLKVKETITHPIGHPKPPTQAGMDGQAWFGPPTHYHILDIWHKQDSSRKCSAWKDFSFKP